MDFIATVEKTVYLMKNATFQDMDSVRHHLADLILLRAPKRKQKDKQEYIFEMKKYQEKLNIKEQKIISGSKMTDQDIDALARVKAGEGFDAELEAETVVLKQMIDQMNGLMITLNTEAKYLS